MLLECIFTGCARIFDWTLLGREPRSTSLACSFRPRASTSTLNSKIHLRRSSSKLGSKFAVERPFHRLLGVDFTKPHILRGQVQVSTHRLKAQRFKVRASNPRNVAYLNVKTPTKDSKLRSQAPSCQIEQCVYIYIYMYICNIHMYICIYVCVYIYIYIYV